MSLEKISENFARNIKFWVLGGHYTKSLKAEQGWVNKYDISTKKRTPTLSVMIQYYLEIWLYFPKSISLTNSALADD